MPDPVVLDDAFQARHLAVPMSQAFSLRAHEPIGEARAKLLERRFDQAPVTDASGPIGFVLTSRLEDASRRPIDTVMTPLGSGNVVSADASVGRLLEWIVVPGFLFVLEGRDITGFITVFDFNKQPARGYLYLLLARLEMGIAELIRRRFASDPMVALRLVGDEAHADVLAKWQADQAANEESEPIAYLDFSDLVRIIQYDDELRGRVSGRSASAWHREAGGLVDLRNQVMHPVRNVVLAKGGLIKLHEREQRIRRLLARVDRAIEEGTA